MDEYSSLNSDDIIIVNEEIESWFLAGIDDSLDTFQGFDIGQSTENIYKEDLDKMIDNSQFDSKIDFMNETAKYFDFNLAISRNNSLNIFLNAYMQKDI